MCVSIIIHNHFKNIPLIIGNNRDEFVNRNFAPPLLLNESPIIVGGKDLVRGGTWLGVNENKIFINILNKWTPDKPFTGSKDFNSRGILVLKLLKLSSLDDISDKLHSLKKDEYLPFYLIVSDIKRVLLFEFDEKLTMYDISNKIFIVGNLPPLKKWNKYNLGYKFLEKVNEPNSLKIIMKRLLSIQKGSRAIPSEDFSVNLNNFQTTSSTILEFYKNRLNYFFANGKPINTTYKDYSFLIRRFKSG